jgi:hypothetical protein
MLHEKAMLEFQAEQRERERQWQDQQKRSDHAWQESVRKADQALQRRQRASDRLWGVLLLVIGGAVSLLIAWLTHKYLGK